MRWPVLAFVIGTLTVLLAGCIAPYGGVGYDEGVGGAAYYEPSGVEYGGWGAGYQIAPFRSGGYRPNGGGGHDSTHAYKSATASRSMPSLPSHGGGGRGDRGGDGGRR